jgi:hypothetical protein
VCVCFVRRDDIPGKPIEPYTCTPHDNTLLSDGKTPMICTPGTDPFVFYFAGGLNKTCPSCDFAERIRKHAEAHPPPYFITTYVRSLPKLPTAGRQIAMPGHARPPHARSVVCSPALRLLLLLLLPMMP